MPAIPLSYVDIAADIAARIKTGEYEPGAKLPSYTQLGDLYSVSFSTAARAVALLRDRGIVVGAPGRGVYVKEQDAGNP
ncbi:winged helix-turn-helix domain-containing protein [Micromonospora sp. NPDC005413]|uniref:winged helix-turn-helix domain-containing protein n=1 Tax=Micromonospora sp. NPDC005413 TaxID=3154563 RepID=UPI0033A0C61D